MTTQFGLYPRFFVKGKDILYPLIEKYTGEPLKDKSQGQVIKVYFNLLRTNATFKAEVDALIKAKGSKLLTIQERVMAKKSVITEKVKSVQGQSAKAMLNYMNATDDVITTDFEGGTEADFIAAITDEEKQVYISDALRFAGCVAVVVAAYYIYKHFKK